ncbi:hypothetical protein NDR87_16175 [Nocardia sp. CDC159]|uniref:HTH cro/C1-type domain-containing protein n=1 Tax=Nocardia pulmonis TaxID=2951408 RepID=A0A9X2E7V2_9NOCA|nr:MULTISPECIES: hypothetical protein [Nocardia]MCM6775369.1 hypothetical protein [Nocardia pulmonis]MCM6787897.1 hypothetical protein [Nocardia sp. CDC159]
MGRRENPLDPAAGPVQRFAVELRKLRQDGGDLTYRAMAQRVNFSATALSQAAAGERLPSLAVTLAYVSACGGDPVEWERRWREAAEQARARPSDDDDSVPPYLGLARFEPQDRDRFFGRDHLADKVTELVRAHRFVALVGASGAGKTSLLRAGLIPRLRDTAPGVRPAAAIRVLTPGDRPASTYAEALRSEGERDTLVVVDQFEEIFTLCTDAEERAAFVDQLLAARDPGSGLRVVVALRADFYGRCAEHRGLAEAVSASQLLVGPMSAEELRQVIVKPAAAAGLIVERALTERLIAEVADQPGGLPLLSHVLLETWRRRTGRALTVAGYEAAGGVHGALAKTAEEAYSRLSAEQAVVARRILLRLIAPGEQAQDTRRPADHTEFDSATGQDTDHVLDTLARARLITVDGSTVDLGHEALITAWPRLNGWIEQDRERLRFHRRLTETTRAWEELGRDPSVLYRGTRLALAREQPLADLTISEREFVQASVDAEDAERLATARNHRRLRHLTVALALLLVGTLVVGLVVFRQREQARAAGQIAASRQLAAQSLSMFDAKPTTGLLLSVEAFRTAPTPEARGAVLSSAAHRAYQGELVGHSDAVSEVTFSPDGNTIASISRDQTVVLWDVQRRVRRATLGHPAWLRTVSFSPDGHTLATGGDDQLVVLWNVDTGLPVAHLPGHTGRVKTLAFSADGQVLASAGADRTVIVWDLKNKVPLVRLDGHAGAVQTVAFSPDARIVATGSADQTIGLWDRESGARLATLAGHTQSVDSVAFSPDGATLASASPDQTVRLWDVGRRAAVTTLRGHTAEARTVAFSPDGRTLASGGHDLTVILWDVEHRRLRARLTGHSNYIYSLEFHPRLPLLASAEENGRILLWDPTRVPLSGHDESVTALAFGPDGALLASTSTDRRVLLWDWRRQRALAAIEGQRAPVNAAAFSPDGRTLVLGGGSPAHATGVDDNFLSIWDVGDPAAPVKVADLIGHRDQVRGVAFSPDGQTLASVGSDGMMLWDVRSAARLATLCHGDYLRDVRFSPDGRTLAALTAYNHTALLFDVATRTRTATLTHSGLPRELAFSPDGRVLATVGTDRSIILWDPRSAAQLATLPQAQTLLSVAFSPDGSRLAAGGVEGTIQLWEVASRTHLATLAGHSGPITSVRFGPDGKTLASAGTDKTIIRWDTDPGEAITSICRTLAADLTPEEWARFLPASPYRRTCTDGERN